MNLERQIAAALEVKSVNDPYAIADLQAQLKSLSLNPVERPASVLVLFGDYRGSDPSLLFILRTDTVETHKGQIAFPGGMFEPVDSSEVRTALRETEEEVGIPSTSVRVLGKLPQLPTFTGFVITPVVGLLEASVSETLMSLDPKEIAAAFWISLSALQEPKHYRVENYVSPISQQSYSTHVFHVGEYRIWGATAAILKNLLDRMKEVSQ